MKSTGNLFLNQPIFDTEHLPHLARRLVRRVRHLNVWEADQAVGYLRACGDERSRVVHGLLLFLFFFLNSQSHHGSPRNGCDWRDVGAELQSSHYSHLLLSFFVSSPTSQQIPAWLSPLFWLFFSFKGIKKKNSPRILAAKSVVKYFKGL